MSGNFVAVGEEADVQQEGDLDAHEELVDEPPEEDDDGNAIGKLSDGIGQYYQRQMPSGEGRRPAQGANAPS